MNVRLVISYLNGIVIALTVTLVFTGCGNPIGAPSPSNEWTAAQFINPGRGYEIGHYTDIDFLNSQEGWVVFFGETVELMHTQDGGRSWSKQSVPIVQVDFADSLHGWAINDTRDRILRTADGGLTWGETSARGKFFMNVVPISGEEAWAFDGRFLLHTRDAGKSWQTVTHPFSGDPNFFIENLTFLDSDHGWVIGSKSGGMTPPVLVLTTTDGGKSFRVTHAPNQTPGVLGTDYSFRFTNRTDGWLASGGPSLLHTQDGGTTWSTVTPRVDGKAVDALYDSCSFPTPQVGWAVGSLGKEALAIETRDGGKTWRRSQTGMEGIRDSCFTQVLFTDEKHGWAIGGGGILGGDFPPTTPHMVDFLLQYQPRTKP